MLPLLRHIAQATKERIENSMTPEYWQMHCWLAGRFQEAEERGPVSDTQVRSPGQLGWLRRISASFHIFFVQTGRFVEAAKLVEEKKGYTRQAGLGPWTQLLDEGRRLQALNALGEYEAVLKAVEDLRVQMKALPERSDQEETVTPWNVREGILDAGREAAMRLERHEKALELNAEQIAVMQSRGATELELAQSRFNDYGPLLRLKRYDEAGGLLLYCKEVFEKERSIQGLGSGLQCPGRFGG